eukprot:1607650-Pyramimonas_sp.AAC.1
MGWGAQRVERVNGACRAYHCASRGRHPARAQGRRAMMASGYGRWKMAPPLMSAAPRAPPSPS